MSLSDNRIVFDPTRMSYSEEEYQLDFTLTEEEKKSFPNLVSMDDVKYFLKAEEASGYYSLNLRAVGDVILKDSHNGEERTIRLDDDADITLVPSKPEESDLEPDADGVYDLRGSILAILFNAIPKNYSTVILSKTFGENYVLMSEEEYYKEKMEKKSNAFSDLDSEDFE